MWLEWYGLEWTKIQLKQTENYYNDSYIWWMKASLILLYIIYYYNIFPAQSSAPHTALSIYFRYDEYH